MFKAAVLLRQSCDFVFNSVLYWLKNHCNNKTTKIVYYIFPSRICLEALGLKEMG